MAAYGLKGPHAIYLVVMQRYEEGVTAARLCELCARDKADVSRAMALMEEKGLVCREGDAAYRARLKLTAEGQRAANHVSDLARIAVEQAGKDITDEHRELFYSALESITANLQTLSKEGLPQA